MVVRKADYSKWLINGMIRILNKDIPNVDTFTINNRKFSLVKYNNSNSIMVYINSDKIIFSFDFETYQITFYKFESISNVYAVWLAVVGEYGQKFVPKINYCTEEGDEIKIPLFSWNNQINMIFDKFLKYNKVESLSLTPYQRFRIDGSYQSQSVIEELTKQLAIFCSYFGVKMPKIWQFKSSIKIGNIDGKSRHKQII